MRPTIVAKESVARAAKGEYGRIRFGFAGASSHLMVSRLVRRITDEHPGIQVGLFSSNFAGVGIEKILDGEFDLACGRWAAIPAGIETRVLTEEQVVLAVAENHSLAHRKTVSFSEVAGDQFIMLPDYPGAVLKDRLFELSSRAGTTPNIGQLAPDTWTVLALIAEGLGVTITFSTVRDSTWFPGVVFLELIDEVMPANLSLAWRSPARPAVQFALDAAVAVFGPEVKERG